MIESREREWCRTCREVTRHDVLPSSGRGAPAFRICADCGFGYSIEETA